MSVSGSGVVAVPGPRVTDSGGGLISPGITTLQIGSGMTVAVDSTLATVTIGATGTGGGGVSSVAQTFTGGIVSVSGSPITSSGTLALTVVGTSGGIPYFSSGTTWASSGVLAANALVVGGGAGVAPSTVTTGTGVLTALSNAPDTAGGFLTTAVISLGGVSGSITLGTGLSMAGSVLNGSSTYTLPAATTSTLGGVIVGSGLSVASGTVSANVTSVAGRTGAVTLAVADVSGAAPLASPALTGTPTAPTATVGTNTTQIATTAFVLANGGGYTLPTASTSTLGGVKVDGSTLGINGSGVASAPTNPARRAVHAVSGTPGTSTITLAAATGRVSVTAILGSTGTRLVEYEVTDGNAMEGGAGLINLATGVLTRSAIDWTWDGTTYTNAPGTGLSLTSAAIVRLVAGDMVPQTFARPILSGAITTVMPWANWGMSTGAIPSGPAMAANTVYFSPVEWRGRAAATKLGVTLGTAVATAKARFALYDMNPTTYGPGKLIVEGTGEADFGTATGGSAVLQYVSLPATIRLPPGWYWAALMNSTAATALRLLASTFSSSMFIANSNPAVGPSSLSKTVTYGTFATAVGDDPALSGFGFGTNPFLVPMLGV